MQKGLEYKIKYQMRMWIIEYFDWKTILHTFESVILFSKTYVSKRKKKMIWLSPMIKAPIPTEKYK